MRLNVVQIFCVFTLFFVLSHYIIILLAITLPSCVPRTLNTITSYKYIIAQFYELCMNIA